MALGLPASSDAPPLHANGCLSDADLSAHFLGNHNHARNSFRMSDPDADHPPIQGTPLRPEGTEHGPGHAGRDPPTLLPNDRSPRGRCSSSRSSVGTDATAPIHSGPPPGTAPPARQPSPLNTRASPQRPGRRNSPDICRRSPPPRGSQCDRTRPEHSPHRAAARAGLPSHTELISHFKTLTSGPAQHKWKSF